MSDAIEAVKRSFFDRAEVLAAVDRGTIRALSKMGAFHRRAQKSLVRYRKKVSEPGKPPSAHRSDKFTRTKTNRKGETKTQSQSPLRELMFFSYDPSSRSVVSGPAKFFKSQVAGKTAPETLEEGGTVVVEKPGPAPSGRKASPQQAATFRRLIAEGRIQAKPRELVKRTFYVRARPSAKPALDSVRPKFADCFKNQVRGR